MEYHEQFVEFDQYCKTCQHEKLAETDSPCDECLDHPLSQTILLRKEGLTYVGEA